jgi:tetratricopeptide (TPR) repeat protein
MYRKRQKMSVAPIGKQVGKQIGKQFRKQVGIIFLASLVAAVTAIALPTQTQSQTIVNLENRALRDEADRLLDVGNTQLKNGKHREAIKTWLYAISYYRRVNDQSSISYTLGRMSEAYLMIGANPAAEETMQQRLTYANTLQEMSTLIQENNNIASLEIGKGNLANATTLTNKVLQLSQQYEQPLGRAIALNNQGLIAGRYGNHLAAIKLYYASLKEQPIRKSIGAGYTFTNSGDSLMALGDYKSAIKDYEQALTIATKHRNFALMSSASDRLIAAYLEIPNFKRIEELLQNRSSLALVMGDRETAANVQRYLGDLYLSWGNVAKARLAYQESYDFAAMLEDTASLPLREAYFKLQALDKL